MIFGVSYLLVYPDKYIHTELKQGNNILKTNREINNKS